MRAPNREWAGIWAGPERNTVIARLASRVIAWPLAGVETGRSRGTWDCIQQFRDRGKAVIIREFWTWPKPA